MHVCTKNMGKNDPLSSVQKKKRPLECNSRLDGTNFKNKKGPPDSIRTTTTTIPKLKEKEGELSKK